MCALTIGAKKRKCRACPTLKNTGIVQFSLYACNSAYQPTVCKFWGSSFVHWSSESFLNLAVVVRIHVFDRSHHTWCKTTDRNKLSTEVPVPHHHNWLGQCWLRLELSASDKQQQLGGGGGGAASQNIFNTSHKAYIFQNIISSLSLWAYLSFCFFAIRWCNVKYKFTKLSSS